MLEKLRELGSGLLNRAAHPLADPAQLRKIVAAIPGADAFRAIDEIAGWLESAAQADDFPADRLFVALTQLDDAAQPFLRRLTLNYLQTPRLSRNDEKHFREAGRGYWTLLAAGYERCLAATGDKSRAADALREALPALCSRLLLALGNCLKWRQFNYEPADGETWRRMGAALAAAEQGGAAERPVALRGSPAGTTTPRREYARWVAFHAASLDTLLPLQIELAERFIAHFGAGLVLSPTAPHDAVYWADLTQARPPLRMAQMPARAEAAQRFFKPGDAYAGIAALLSEAELGRDLPTEINLGGQYHARGLVPVLRHLATYLAPVPPQRRHERHRVKQRVQVVHGLGDVYATVAGRLVAGESWVVEDISRGGFGALVNRISGEWLKSDALLAIHPDGGQGWQVGIVRRCRRLADGTARVGIEALALLPQAVEVRARGATGYSAVAGIPALWFREGVAAGEVGLVLPINTFDLRTPLETQRDGARLALEPVALIGQGPDYDLARYRPGGG